MKVFLALTLAAFVASVNGSFQYLEDGKEYVFETEAAASSGSMDYATHTSGFSYKMNTRVQVSGRTLNIKFEKLSWTQYVGAHDANAWPYDNTKWTDIPANPPAFAIKVDSNGLFSELIVPSGASVFEKNMMRGWASALQINTEPIKAGKRAFRSKEQSINGKCDVRYSISPQAVRKTVSHGDDCETRVYRIVDDYRSFRCDGKSTNKGPGYPSSLATTVFKLNIIDGRPRIVAIAQSGTFISQLFEEEGAAQAVYTNQTSFMVEKKSSSGDISVSGGQSIKDLSYEWSDSEYAWDKNRDLKAKEPFFATGDFFSDSQANLKQVVLKGIAAQKTIIQGLDKSAESVQKAHRYGINSIFPAFMALDYSSLKDLADKLYADKSDSGVAKSNIFGELLGSAGTTAAALVVRDLIIEDKFDNGRDAARILTSVPFHIRRPNKQLVQEYAKLIGSTDKRMVTQSVPLVMGHLVRMTCKRAGNPGSKEQLACFKTLAADWADKMWNKFESSSDRKEKGLIIAAMANLRYGGVAKLLKPLILGKTADKDDHQLRVSALHAASREAIVTGNGVEAFLPIFANRDNCHELRISALELLFHCKPTPSDMSNVVAVLYGEKDYEVYNYAYALFTRWADSIDPCMRETKELAQYFLKYMTQYSNYAAEFGFGMSKTYSRAFQKKKYGYGGSYMFYVVGSEKSFAPISFGATMSTTLSSNFKTYLLGVHIRVEGLAKALIRKFKKTDPATWKTDDLKKILNTDMNIRERPDQPVRVQVSITLKGSIVFHRYYDDDSAKPDGHIMKFFAKMKGMGEQYTINHQRAIQIGGLLYEQPTPLGLPMAVLSSTTTLSHLKATVKRGNSRGLLYRDISYDAHAFTQSARAALIRHPMRKVSYGIMNDRIYHVHIPRKMVIGVNPIKRELKLSISRPEYDNPWRVFMHSQTQVMARGNTVRGDYPGLSDNCPSCKSRVTITRGPQFIKNRDIINRDSDKYGYRIQGEYFNCEMDIRRANTFKHIFGAFMPYNKTPKTAWTSIMMGIRQIKAFFYYFPKNEQCGAQLVWSQSKVNPTTDIEITIRGNGEKNGERMFFRGRKIFVKAIIKAKGSNERLYKVNLAYEFTPGNIQNKIKLQINRNPVPALSLPPFSLCFALENQYPEFSGEFLDYGKGKDLKMSGKAMVQYGAAASCAAGDGEIRLNFEHSTTSEAREQLKNKWYYQKCMQQANLPQWKSRGSTPPITEECMMSVYDATTARKYTWDIEFVKVTERLKRISSRVKSLVEAGFLPWWDSDPEDGAGPDGDIGPFLNLGLTFKNDEKNVDVDVETRRGKRKYEDVPLRLNWSKRMRNLKFTKTLRRLFYSKIINPCIVTSADVRTNDNVTYTYSPPTCWTLASSKCGPNPEYAVFIKRSAGLPLAAQAFIGGHKVEFTPSGSDISVKINGAAISVSDGEQKDHTSSGVEIFKIFRWGKSYHIYSFLRVWIVYDGNFIEVVPAPSAFGQHCGICGNYNRNKYDEFTGKDLSLKKTAADLVNDWKWKC